MTAIRLAGGAAALVIVLLGGLLAFAAVDDARAHREAPAAARQVHDLGGQLVAWARLWRDVASPVRLPTALACSTLASAWGRAAA